MADFEMVICPHCGKETPGNQTICQHCYGEYTLADSDDSSAYMYDVEDRNGFVGFYLWLGLILNSIIGVGYFISLFTRIGMTSAYEPMISRFLGTLISAGTVAGFWLLLKYKKLGFYLLTATAILTILINLGFGGVSLATLSPLVMLGVLFAVLQIRKNGRSCWSYLS